MNKVVRKVLVVIWMIVLCLSSIFVLAERWLIQSWSSMSADELIFHLSSSMKGANMDVVTRLILYYYLPGFVVLALVFALFFASKKSAFKKCVYAISFAAYLILLVLSICDLENKTGLVSRIIPSSGNDEGYDFIEANYIDTSIVSFSFPETKRNLIYIYLESMEITFADVENGGAFPDNLIPNLTVIAGEYEDFGGDSALLNGAYSLPSTDWTMAGMFAQSSGMPLKVAVKTNYEEEGFFPNLVTLGDILQDAGYSQTILFGSEAEFGGRGNFYSSHGNFELHDYIYAVENGWIPEGYSVWWGFEDSKLFEFAKEDLMEISAEDQPFHYVLLTADTHFEDGYVCELCGNEHGDNQYANVFSCSDRQVYHFLEWLMEQDFWDNTTVVLCGDHTTMDSDFCDEVPGDYGRRTYSVIINGSVDTYDNSRIRQYSTLDMFPTTLAAIGVTMSSDKLGLGVNLYSDTPTILEEYGLDYCRDRLEARSEFMMELFGEKKEDAEELLRDAVIRMTFVEENDDLSLLMWGFGDLNPQYIDDIYVEVTDSRTGKTKRYSMLIDDENNPNPYSSNVVLDYPVEDKQYLEAAGYIAFNGLDPIEVVRISGTD